LVDRTGFGHAFVSADTPRYPASAPVAPAAFSSATASFPPAKRQS